MAYPVSQLRKLYKGLLAAPSLKGVRILLGARHMAKSGSAPRIVLFPKGGTLVLPRQKDTNNLSGITVPGIGSVRDIRRVVLAHLWAASGENTDAHFDAMEDLYNRFFQALDYQAIGGLPSNASAIPGVYWEADEEEWDANQDTGKQGEEVYIALTIWTATTPALGGVGTVESTAISKQTGALAADMGASDVIASLVSTAGFPNTGGTLAIDAEQIRYTGIAGNQFLGLVRGVNNTTPSSHLAGSTVNVF